MRRLAVIGCAAALLLAGVAGAGQRDYRRHVVHGYGVSLSLPSSWKGLDSRQARKLLTDLDSFTHDNPQLVGAIAQLRQPDSPLKFVAFDPIPFRQFATNVNIIVVTLSRDLSLPEYERVITAEVSSIPISDLQVRRVRLPGGQAVRLAYNVRLKINREAVTTSATQYAFRRRRRSVVVTYTTLPQSRRLYAPIFATSARSIRFTS